MTTDDDSIAQSCVKKMREQSAEIESLRAQLAEAKKELGEANEAALNNFEAVQEIDLWLAMHDVLEITHEGGGKAAGLNVVDALESMRNQLLATQAHAARLVEALDSCLDDTKEALADWKEQYGDHRHEIATYGKKVEQAEAILSTPVNLDALHEDRARTLEVAAKNWIYGSTFSVLNQMAAAHRAKKVEDGKS